MNMHAVKYERIALKENMITSDTKTYAEAFTNKRCDMDATADVRMIAEQHITVNHTDDQPGKAECWSRFGKTSGYFQEEMLESLHRHREQGGWLCRNCL